MKKIFAKIEYPQTTIKPSHLIKEELIEQVKAEILAMDLPIITTGLLTNPLTIQHKMYLYVLTEQQLESIKHEAVIDYKKSQNLFKKWTMKNPDLFFMQLLKQLFLNTLKTPDKQVSK